MARLGSGRRGNGRWGRRARQGTHGLGTASRAWDAYSTAWGLALVGVLLFLNGISVTTVSVLFSTSVHSGVVIAVVTLFAAGAFVLVVSASIREALVRGLSILATAIAGRLGPGSRRRDPNRL